MLADVPFECNGSHATGKPDTTAGRGRRRPAIRDSARPRLLDGVGDGLLAYFRHHREDRDVVLLEDRVDLGAAALEHRLQAVAELLVPAAHRDPHVVLE